MSVLIKGMEMPESCGCCPMCYCDHYGYVMCTLINEEVNLKTQSPDCPLTEVKEPHGRTIDVDKFKADYGMKNECADCKKELKGRMKSCEYDRIYSKMDFCQWLDNADTVIEAEGREE